MQGASLYTADAVVLRLYARAHAAEAASLAAVSSFADKDLAQVCVCEREREREREKERKREKEKEKGKERGREGGREGEGVRGGFRLPGKQRGLTRQAPYFM
jgi:hypothetical protein